MSAIHSTHERLSEPSPAMLLLFAIGTGLSVATLYYNQPMLGVIGRDLHAEPGSLGLIPTLTQIGYALGILFLAPLGDRHDRRGIIVGKAAVLCVALLCAAWAPSVSALGLASLVIGVSATLAQDIVPVAAMLSPDAIRGRVVGTVMTGLLLGILLSRVVSGVVAAHAGWQAMFLAAASIVVLGLAAWRTLPVMAPTTQLSYGELLASLGSLWRRHAALRRATLAQGLLSVAFAAFWSTLALFLQAGPFHLGSAVAGAFGLAGAAGALIAPLAGRLADRQGPERVTRGGALLVACAFAIMLALPWLSVPVSLGLLGVATILFDLGVQAALIAHQTIVYGLDPAARSRLNAVLVVGLFCGMAGGSALAGWLFALAGWPAVVGLSLSAAVGALLVRMWPRA